VPGWLKPVSAPQDRFSTKPMAPGNLCKNLLHDCYIILILLYNSKVSQVILSEFMTAFGIAQGPWQVSVLGLDKAGQGKGPV
jgi:hypothetical protein